MASRAGEKSEKEIPYPLIPPFSQHADLNIWKEKNAEKEEAQAVAGAAESSDEEGNNLSTSRSSPIVTRMNGDYASTPSADIDELTKAAAKREKPLKPRETLPTFFQDAEKKVVPVESEISEFLKQDLDTSRLNRIHGVLWMAGRPLIARALHRQVMLDMRILRTEQADMHVLKVSDRLFVKPLPAYLLSYDFWNEHFCPRDLNPEDDSDADFKDRGDKRRLANELHKRACGLLLSYVWLIRSELDMKIAKDEHLVPKGVTWLYWKDFVADLIDDKIEGHINANSLHQVDKRYKYGELRLSRINSIYRIGLFSTHFIRGYLYGYNRYVVFFKRNFGWMIVIFAYFSLVLSAMQVGVSIEPLSNSYAFTQASYGFVVFSMTLVAAVMGLVALLFPVIFITNTILSFRHSRMAKQERKRISNERRQGRRV